MRYVVPEDQVGRYPGRWYDRQESPNGHIPFLQLCQSQRAKTSTTTLFSRQFCQSYNTLGFVETGVLIFQLVQSRKSQCEDCMEEVMVVKRSRRKWANSWRESSHSHGYDLTHELQSRSNGPFMAVLRGDCLIKAPMNAVRGQSWRPRSQTDRFRQRWLATLEKGSSSQRTIGSIEDMTNNVAVRDP